LGNCIYDKQHVDKVSKNTLQTGAGILSSAPINPYIGVYPQRGVNDTSTITSTEDSNPGGETPQSNNTMALPAKNQNSGNYLQPASFQPTPYQPTPSNNNRTSQIPDPSQSSTSDDAIELLDLADEPTPAPVTYSVGQKRNTSALLSTYSQSSNGTVNGNSRPVKKAKSG